MLNLYAVKNWKSQNKTDSQFKEENKIIIQHRSTQYNNYNINKIKSRQIHISADHNSK